MPPACRFQVDLPILPELLEFRSLSLTLLAAAALVSLSGTAALLALLALLPAGRIPRFLSRLIALIRLIGLIHDFSPMAADRALRSLSRCRQPWSKKVSANTWLPFAGSL